MTLAFVWSCMFTVLVGWLGWQVVKTACALLLFLLAWVFSGFAPLKFTRTKE